MGRDNSEACCDLEKFQAVVGLRLDAQDKAISDVKWQVGSLADKVAGLSVEMALLRQDMKLWGKIFGVFITVAGIAVAGVLMKLFSG
jgi:hypothetical protein